MTAVEQARENRKRKRTYIEKLTDPANTKTARKVADELGIKHPELVRWSRGKAFRRDFAKALIAAKFERDVNLFRAGVNAAQTLATSDDPPASAQRAANTSLKVVAPDPLTKPARRPSDPSKFTIHPDAYPLLDELESRPPLPDDLARGEFEFQPEESQPLTPENAPFKTPQ